MEKLSCKNTWDYASDLQFDNVEKRGCFSFTENINMVNSLFGKEQVDYYPIPVKIHSRQVLIYASLELITLQEGQSYVVYRNMNIYIKDGEVASLLKFKVKYKFKVKVKKDILRNLII